MAVSIRNLSLALPPVLCALLGGCAAPAEPLVNGPILVPPAAKPTYVERANTGSLFQPTMSAGLLFTGQKRPSNVGDTLKIDISESLAASNKLSANMSRSNSLSQQGPGDSSSMGGVFKSLVDMSGTASGSDSFKGAGDSQNANTFNGKIAVSVINVLSNGNLVVAGERMVAFNKGKTTLRFSGVVNPQDIKTGNIVASSDVVNARVEAVGDGEASETAGRSWLQRVLTNGLSIW